MHNRYHALVWMDHQAAKIFHFDAAESEQLTVRSSHPHQHIHHKANAIGSGHSHVDADYLQRVTAALETAGAILITGPANAKTELVTYIKHRRPQLAERISGVETLDHPSDGELLALGRRFFKADDRMHSQNIR